VVTRPSSNASDVAISVAFAASLSWLVEDKVHSSGASITQSTDTNSVAATFLIRDLLRSPSSA
jgi:hypothetical protein